jgi:hypothetical protein
MPASKDCHDIHAELYFHHNSFQIMAGFTEHRSAQVINVGITYFVYLMINSVLINAPKDLPKYNEAEQAVCHAVSFLLEYADK